MTADAAGHLGDRGEQLLPQTNAGKGIRGQKLQLSIGKAAATRGANEGLEGGLAQLRLQPIPHLDPELFARLRQNRPSPER